MYPKVCYAEKTVSYLKGDQVAMFKPLKTQLKKPVEKLFTLVPDNLILRNYCKRYVDRFDGDNNEDILLNGEADLLQRYMPRSEVVFDVEANVGNWAQTALSFNRNAKLYCFEPFSVTFQRLSQRHFPPNVILNNFGLSSSPEERTMYGSDDHVDSGLSSLYKREIIGILGLKTPDQEETIHLETLDNYCLKQGIERIDLLKLDVEGHELAVLTGAKRMLETERINVIQFEYNNTHIDSRVFLKDFFELFKETNYSLYKIHPKRLRLVERYDFRMENFQYQNWAIIRKGWN